MVQFTTASALNWSPRGAIYFNSNRNILDTNSLSPSEDFIESPPLQGIKDVSINHETIFFLTERKGMNDIFSNERSISAFGLSSLPLSSDSISVGLSGNPAFVEYYYCANSPQYNRTVDIKTFNYNLPTNYVLFSPIRAIKGPYQKIEDDPFSDIITSLKFNIFGLKNYMTPCYEYDVTGNISQRDYSKLFLGTNQKFGYSNIFLGYSSNTTQFVFNNNDTTYFHYPYNAPNEYLNYTTLISRGAKAGDSPMNSDIIAEDQFGYFLNTSSGGTSKRNGNFLCAWLSGSNDCSCDSVWVERWFNPDTVSQGDAYILPSLDVSCDGVWDIESNIELIPTKKYYYDRYGEDRNDLVVKSLSSKLIAHYDQWSHILLDSSGNNNNGHIFEKYPEETDTLICNGKIHAHISPTPTLLREREISVGAFAKKDDWSCGKTSQIVGNYFFGGWGIFYNTGIPNSIISVGDTDGGLYSFNIEGTRLFEKNLEAVKTINNVSVDWFATDLNGVRWILDAYSNKIYKIEVNDLLVEVINFPNSYNVNKIQIDPNNRLYLHDLTNSKVFVHDELGTYVESFNAPASATLFELDSVGEIVFDVGDILSLNSQNVKYRAWGSNLYKNEEVLYHFNDKILDLKIDSDDNIWIIYDGNKLVKIDSEDNIIFSRRVLSTFKTESSPKLGLTRIANSNGCDENRVWVIFETFKYLVEVNTNGEVLNAIDTSQYIITKTCTKYALRARGDFTGFDVNRKYEIVNGKNISLTNPALTLKVKLKNKCGIKQFKFIHLPISNLESGWHHLAMTYNGNSGKLKLFLDGILGGIANLDPGLWNIDYNNITPIIIGGNSGKLGSENIERSIINSQYFIGNIDDVRIYSKELTPFNIKALSDIKLKLFEDLTWNIETQSKNYVERVDKFFMNKKPGHATRLFNIKINGLDIPADLKLLIESSIKDSVEKIIPTHTELHAVVWS